MTSKEATSYSPAETNDWSLSTILEQASSKAIWNGSHHWALENPHAFM